MATRDEVVSLARSYLGTPFLHRGRVPGLALDCIGVPICACRTLGTVAPDFDVAEYTMSANGPRFVHLCDQYLSRKAGPLEVGDLVALKIKKVASHVGILGDYYAGGFSLIHASMADQRVVEMRLVFDRYLVLAGAYRLPGVA